MASKKNKAAAATATPAPAAAKPTPPPAPVKPPVVINKVIQDMSFEALQAQMEAKRDQEVVAVKTQIEKLDEQRDALSKRLADLTGTLVKPRKRGGGGPRGPRPENEKSLAEYLHEALKSAGHVSGGTPIKAQDAVALLAKTAWKSNAKNQYMSVFTALTKKPDLFEKIARGQFVAK